MLEYIKYREKRYRAVRLHIRTDTDFNDILTEINEVEFCTTVIPSEQIMYAVLELVNNSIRAQKEKNIQKKILLEFRLQEPDTLYIKIQDWGGGFDIQKLPYDLETSTDSVDTNSETFQEYREEHGYMRFGIGLYVVKKTFTLFKLSFIDENLNHVTWESGKTKGTCIELYLKNSETQGEKNG